MAAFTISSQKLATQSKVKDLFLFLSDFQNFRSILPEDKVENFQFDGDHCSFNIKGITPMSIRISEKKPYDYIFFSSEGLAKFNFCLRCSFEGEAESQGLCLIELHGDLNPFIKAMAEKPLKNLVETMTLRLSQLQISE